MTERDAVIGLSTAVDELLAIADRRPEAGWDPFRSRVGAGQYMRLYEAIVRCVPRNARVLDWGAGLGHLSYLLTRWGFRAVGFALEPCILAKNAGSRRFAFVRGGPADPIHLPFRDQSFDAVVSAGVLEHVHEIGGSERESLREIRRTLRPGGVFICAHLPNRTSWIESVARGLGWYAHERRFGAREVRELVHEADLALLEWSRYGFLPHNRWAQLPASVRWSRGIATGWRAADSLGSAVLPGLCQNHLFVARKPNE